MSNNPGYSWYINQSSTGDLSNINCGPTATTMAMHWADSSYTGTTQDARNYYPQNSGEWGISTIMGYLGDAHFPNQYITFGDSAWKTRDIIKAQLDKGNILILLVDMLDIRPYSGAFTDPHVDRYYPDLGGHHFIVVYGYKVVDDAFYFQVNDPWGLNYTNKDGTPSGASRFYRADDIFLALLNTSNDGVVISKK